MGNKPAKQQETKNKKNNMVMVKVAPLLDPTSVRWLARDLERIHGFVSKNPRAIQPPDHYIEYMRLQGWLDIDLDHPDLAPLFK